MPGGGGRGSFDRCSKGWCTTEQVFSLKVHVTIAADCNKGLPRVACFVLQGSGRLPCDAKKDIGCAVPDHGCGACAAPCQPAHRARRQKLIAVEPTGACMFASEFAVVSPSFLVIDAFTAVVVKRTCSN
jgi:hypothetical protein